ncbi:MAG: hypothetical protein FWC39_03295 [Bacteroidetes bacterium]|nr:hypothetical protein [Bacteroidota bacterium]
MRSRTHSNLFYRFILKMKIVLMFFLFVHSLFGQSFVLPAVTPMIVIGGIYYGKTAVINKNDNLKMQLAILDYDLSTQTMKMQFGNKAYYSNIPTWQLIPLVKYVESNDPIILSITMLESNDKMIRPIHYHPAFANTILGLRFLQADLLYTRAYEELEPRLLNIFADGETDFSATSKPYHLGNDDSYMLTDLHSDIEFKTLENQFYLTGEPYYLFTQNAYDLNHYLHIIRNHVGKQIDQKEFYPLKTILENNTENFSWEWEKLHNTIDFMYTKTYATKVAKRLRKLIVDEDISPNDTELYTYSYYINNVYEKILLLEKASEYDYNFIDASQFKDHFDWLHKEFPERQSIKEICEIDKNVTSALSDSTLHKGNYAKNIAALKLEPIQELYVISQIALKKEISAITVPTSLKFIDENVFSYNPNAMNACIQAMRWSALFRNLKSANPKEWNKFVNKVSSFDDSSFKINTPKNLKVKTRSYYDY